MHRQSQLMRAIADFIGYVLRKDRASGKAARVLQFNQPGLRTIVRRRRNLLFDLRPGNHAIFAIDRARLAAGKRRHRCRFQVDEVCALLADNLLPMLRVAADRHLVAHGPRWNKDRGLFLENLRRPLGEPVHGGIFTVNVVRHLGFSHGATHFRRGLGDGVTAQVDGALSFCVAPLS